MEQGRRAGLWSVLGILVGTLFHIAAAALGISALLLSSAMAFNTLRYLVLGIVFIVLAAMTDAVLAIVTGTAGNWVKGSPRFTRIQRYITAGALIGLGAAAAVSGNGRK